MSAFSEDGGYAAIMQVVPGTIRVTGGVNGQENLATWRDLPRSFHCSIQRR